MQNLSVKIPPFIDSMNVKRKLAFMLTRFSLRILAILWTSASWGYDCSNVKPFVPIGSQLTNVTIDRIYWTSQNTQQTENFENICRVTVTISAYDIRGREEEAYWCLKPSAGEVIACDASFDQVPSAIVVIPAIWIRIIGNGKAQRDYHFHALVLPKNDPSMFARDLYSRALLPDLKPQSIYIDSSFKDGAPTYHDGYFVETQFQ